MENLDIDVVKRDGEVTKYDRNKIKSALDKAYQSCGINDFPGLEIILQRIEDEIATRFLDSDLLVNVENIHDIVEKQLMSGQQFPVAKAYIIYRSKKREKEIDNRKKASFLKSLIVVKNDKSMVSFNPKKLKDAIKRHSQGLIVDQALVFQETAKNVFNQMKTSDIDKSLIMSATSLIEQEPDYSILAARFFRQKLAKEVFCKSVNKGTGEWDQEYRRSFITAIQEGVEAGVVDKRLLEKFDLIKLSKELVLERDELVKYMGIQTLYERYFTKIGPRRTEMLQTFWMRVAMGLSINEDDPNTRAIEFYHLMSQLYYTPSTPTLFHSGLHSPQLSSCYLSTVDDDLRHIFQSFSDNAQMSKWSGGIGNDWTNVRSTGANIKSTMVESQGVIPFLKIANDTTVAINRSGKRRGATAAYLETWHLDIEDFLDLRKNTGDERRRSPDMDTVNWIPDLFMKRVNENGRWTLFSPDEVPDLHHIYGKKFEERYAYYEKQADEGNISKFKVVEAVKLMRKMITQLFETGHPWFTFKDPCNIRSPQDHVGVIHNSNLCTEIALNTSPTRRNDDGTIKELGEVAVCLVAGTKIQTINGLVDIEKCDGADVLVPLVSDTDHRNNSRFVKAKLIDNGFKEVFKISTKSGPYIEATCDHLFMVYEKCGQKRPGRLQDTLSKFVWKRVDELSIGDKIYSPETSSVKYNNGFCAEYATLGWFLGDGWFTDSCGLVFGPEEKYAEEVTVPVFRSFYDNVCNGDSYKFPLVHQQHNGVRMWSSEKTGLHDLLLNKYGFKRGRGPFKRLPSKIWAWDLKQQANFLSGLFSADGGIGIDKKGLTLHLASSSLEVLDEVQVLLKSFGVHMRKTWFYVKSRDRWQGSLRTGSLTSIAAFADAIGFNLSPVKDKCLKTLLASCGSSQRQALPYFKVSAIKQNGKKQVYDLSLSEGHHFLANGFVVHNCNLGSINVVRHMVDGKVDWVRLITTVKIAVRMLDNVIDINFYPIPEARFSNLRHRPVGLGFMGFQDALFVADLRYEEADDFADELQEFISYYAISASCDLAAERGKYETYEGSKWSRGIFPLDTVDLLEQERGSPIEVDRKTRQDWAALKAKVATHGMRNSNVMAVAPTATIATIVGVLGPCGESIYKNIFAKANMSGEYTILNEYLVNDLKKLDLWDKDMLDQIKFHNGSIQKIEKIPLRLRAKYKEAFEIDQKRSIDLTALRSKWIDQSQSHNIFSDSKNGKFLMDLYMYAWRKGLKTTYYLRGLGATGVEKSTLDAKFGLTQKRDEVQNEVQEVKLCKINDPTCEACQ